MEHFLVNLVRFHFFRFINLHHQENKSRKTKTSDVVANCVKCLNLSYSTTFAFWKIKLVLIKKISQDHYEFTKNTLNGATFLNPKNLKSQ